MAARILHLGIIGMGYAGRQQLQAAETIPSLRIVAAADPLLTETSFLAHDVKLYQDWQDLLQDEAVEAVSICLPHHLHTSVATAALQAGKDVLIEKPLAANAGEARAIQQMAEQHRRSLMVEMTHRFYPPIRAARDLIQSGRLGQIFAIEDRVVEPVSERIAPWLTQRQLAGGGVALTNGIHMLDRVAFVCGQPLRFVGGVAGWSQRLGDVEDTAALQLALADGTPVQILAAWPRGKSRIDDELTVYGTQGTLRVWAWRGWRFEPAGSVPEDHESYPADLDLLARVRVGMKAALTEFGTAILDGRPPEPSAAPIIAAQEILDQFYQSAMNPDRSL